MVERDLIKRKRENGESCVKREKEREREKNTELRGLKKIINPHPSCYLTWHDMQFLYHG